MYDEASKPEMFIRVSHSVIGAIVAFLRSGSHAVSFGDKPLASLIVGLAAGQETSAGAYPPEGLLGSARARATAAYSSAAPSRGIMTVDAEVILACHHEVGLRIVYHYRAPMRRETLEQC